MHNTKDRNCATVTIFTVCVYTNFFLLDRPFFPPWIQICLCMVSAYPVMNLSSPQDLWTHWQTLNLVGTNIKFLRHSVFLQHSAEKKGKTVPSMRGNSRVGTPQCPVPIYPVNDTAWAAVKNLESGKGIEEETWEKWEETASLVLLFTG